MEQEKKVVDIYSLNKSKRILVWICEAIITFFFAYILMHAAVTPLYSLIGGYSKIADNASNSIKIRNKSLVKEELLYFENEEGQIEEIGYGLSYTYDLFMGDFIEGGSRADAHNIFKRYYQKFDNLDNYFNDFKHYDEDFNFFNFDNSTKEITMKETYKTKFNAIIDPSDEMSSSAETEYNKYMNKSFLTFYSHILKKAKENNIILDGHSYSELQSAIDKSNSFYDRMTIIGSFISFGLAWGISSIIIPLCNRNRRSISMIMMRIQRVTSNEFKILKVKRLLLVSFYNLITYMFLLCFLPLPLISFGNLFAMPILLYPSIVSTGLCIFSWITLLINGNNQSTSDMLSYTIFVSNETLDDIYRAKGYIIN